jgi:iron complex outermembrane receptor protein
MPVRCFPALVAGVLVVFPLSVAAAVHMPVIVVTPSAFEQTRDEANSAITIIDRQTIEQANAGSVVELLRGQAGLNVRDLFGDGREAVIDLRGFGPTASSNTLVLVDGRRLNNAADQGAPDLSTIDLDRVERIEVLQGSAGVLYGNQAVGGVINIITRKVGADDTRLSLRVGSYSSVQARATLERLLGRTQLSLALTDQQSDNYRDHNESDNRNARLRVTRQHDSFSAFIEVQRVEDEIQTPGALLGSEMALSRTQSLPVYTQDYFATDTDLLRLGFDKHLNDEQLLRVDLSSRQSDREFIQSFRPTPGTITTQDRDTRLLSVNWRYQPSESSLASLVVGGDIDDTDYALLSQAGPQNMQQTLQDIFVSSQWRLSPVLRLDAGIRHSRRDADIQSTAFGARTDLAFDDSETVSGLGLTWSLDALRLFLRADQNLRYPTVEEHTSPVFGQPPGLDTQKGLSIELGAELLLAEQRYRVSLYNIRLDHEIGFDSTGFANLNLDRTERNGLILEASRQWTAQLQSSFSATFIDAEISSGPFQGGDLPLVPERSLRVDLNWVIDDATRSGVEWLYTGKQVFGGDFANQLSRLPSWQVINAHLSYTMKAWQARLRVNNLFDERYSETGSQYSDFSNFPAVRQHEAYFPSPERNYWVTLEYHF